MPRMLRSGALLALALSAPVLASAQSTTSIHYNLAAGASLAAGSFGDRNDTSYNFMVGVGMEQPASALGFRAEGIYNEFSEKFGSDKSHAGGITGNVTYNLIQPSRTQSNTLYLIGGIGYYSTKEPFFDFESQSNVGYNIGGGFKFPLSGFSAYVEARYHTVSNVDVKFVPISFGLVF
ncbi:MAG: hypothetical protein JWM41_3742 [Gemmatimonadetes bacterium]|nr:hypothetical protein [Gemmatimonadota bacterium]